MGRPPCCDKLGVKKGPWTPEEDIMLVSYVQEHGPGNWRSVPPNTGLKRCSKSCRLRWTNYLRPGIKRGTFTDHEEKMIIQLQALLGNKWAAIASYLPERTDNDIKNFWNTHLKKKLDRIQSGSGTRETANGSSKPISRGQWERRLQTDIQTAKQALANALSVSTSESMEEEVVVMTNPKFAPNPIQTTSYASSTENIARLLKDWANKTPKCEDISNYNYSSCSTEEIIAGGADLGEGWLGFDSFESYSPMSSDDFSGSVSPKPDPDGVLALEKWLLDDQGFQGLFDT